MFPSLPSFYQWKEVLRSLSKKEYLMLCGLLFAAILSAGYLVRTFFVDHTLLAPTRGGNFAEGIVGSPRFLNPLYAVSQDADRDLSEVIYSGLLSYDEKGNLVTELASSYEISQEGKSIEVTLKDKVKWHDGASFTADDVLFTIQAIQDPSAKSPLRPSWIGVGVEKISDLRVRFTIREPYAAFVERLTVKIIPSHVWKNTSPENLAFSSLQVTPVGTGPFKVSKITKDRMGQVKEVRLKAFPEYYGDTPYLSTLTFTFFASEDALLREAGRKGNIHAFALSNPQSLGNFQLGKTVHSFRLPRYFALFFNLASPSAPGAIGEVKVRKALAMATDREALVTQALSEHGNIVTSPLLPSLFGFSEPSSLPYDKEQALALLKEAGFTLQDGTLVKKDGGNKPFKSDLKKGSQGAEVKLLQECLAKDPSIYPEGTVNGIFGTGTFDAVVRFQEKYSEDILQPSGLTRGNGLVRAGTREKLNEVCFPPTEQKGLVLTLTTVDQPQMIKIAQALSIQWKEIGVTLKLASVSPSQIERDVIKPRNYEILLFGELLGMIPDPYPFWHSSQKRDPGLNLSSWENKSADALLVNIRKELNEEQRNHSLEKLQDIFISDLPAIPLYDVDFLYVTSKQVGGMEEGFIADPSQRFRNIERWHVKTKRQWDF